MHGHDDTWCNYPRRWNAGAVAEKNFAKVYHPKSCRLEKHIFLTKQHPVSVYIENLIFIEYLSCEIDAVSSSGGRGESASMVGNICRKMFISMNRHPYSEIEKNHDRRE